MSAMYVVQSFSTGKRGQLVPEWEDAKLIDAFGDIPDEVHQMDRI